ncbi:O-antigen ligase family protein [Roseomonas marmotae]|uniref:O-antigen ligase family protein n=1 Tax=Roseomonas marmotae TaxID=2768161 RepID=A0ABS3KA71_9PROT|nr:O-antigen ligase family protein [Roseomonas marmotae]MBO1074371.1 O-antigen ligase family protein [Roseomonas marmotae]QTI78116.1 O-antigen ligase family protein [Roseomonas marmotae]
MTSSSAPDAPFRWATPSLPLMAGALLAPLAAVLQSKAMTPLGLLSLVACIALARWRGGRWPWPGGAPLWAGLALGGWGMLSALWAIDPRRSLSEGAVLAGMVLLAGAAAAAVRQDEPGQRRRLGLAVLLGLAIGLGAALFDHLSGNALRAAVRGLREVPPELAFGLKPAASVMALMLPLLAGAALPGRWRAAALLLGMAILLALPGDTAKLAALAGVATAALVALWPRTMPRFLAWALAAVVLATPPLLGPATGLLGPRVESLPPSGIHRLLIWDFALQRAAEKPLAGWGMESSRAIPGGQGQPDPSRLAVTRADLRAWFAQPHLRLLPLHPHNGPLQIRLELGWIGTLIAAAGLLLLGLAAARCAMPAAATGALASGFVTFYASFGVWQNWWLCVAAMALAIAAGLPVRR